MRRYLALPLAPALASGSEGDVDTIVRYARAADPASGDAVLGGYLATGNSDTLGIAGSIDATREGVRWRHKFRAQADDRQSRGIVSREHYLTSYEPNHKLDDRAHLYRQARFESDRLLGYTRHYSTSLGADYNALKTSRLTLDLELGPAYRHIDFTDAKVQSSIASRGSMDMNWKLFRGLSVSQVASAYVQRYNSAVSSATYVTAKVLGALSAQLSYNVQYESMPPWGSVSTDTTSRAALIYSF